MSKQTVTGLFLTITGADNVTLLVDCLAIAGSIGVIVHIITAQQLSSSALVLLAYALVCWVAGGLVAFTCYFVFFHSPLHLGHWREQLQYDGTGIIYGLSLVVIAFIAGALWATFSSHSIVAEVLSQTSLRYTFIAIAALTAPHMTLLMIANRKVQH